jgi:uncharacterized membrane protein YdjX (TVP38/TMEM64 family)
VDLASLQQHQADWAALHDHSPWQLRACFFLAYLALAGVSLPGTALLSVAGGAVFGFGWGLLMASFAGSLGALASFWLSRTLLRGWVQRRQLAVVNAGLEQSGILYLFGLRLIPLVPFFLVNLTMGLTTLRPWTFYWVSQLGMLAGTSMYVNAGLQLASLQSLDDIASPTLLASLALLGVFPLAVRAFWQWVQPERLYTRWVQRFPRWRRR